MSSLLPQKSRKVRFAALFGSLFKRRRTAGFVDLTPVSSPSRLAAVVKSQGQIYFPSLADHVEDGAAGADLVPAYGGEDSSPTGFLPKGKVVIGFGDESMIALEDDDPLTAEFVRVADRMMRPARWRSLIAPRVGI